MKLPSISADSNEITLSMIKSDFHRIIPEIDSSNARNIFGSNFSARPATSAESPSKRMRFSPSHAIFSGLASSCSNYSGFSGIKASRKAMASPKNAYSCDSPWPSGRNGSICLNALKLMRPVAIWAEYLEQRVRILRIWEIVWTEKTRFESSAYLS